MGRIPYRALFLAPNEKCQGLATCLYSRGITVRQNSAATLHFRRHVGHADATGWLLVSIALLAPGMLEILALECHRPVIKIIQNIPS